MKINYNQKWIFLIGLDLNTLNFPYISEKLTDKSIEKKPVFREIKI
jgi:hypothetical protein